jgi:CBS domain-containing protein
MAVTVATILNRKGTDVLTIAPDATIAVAADMLTDNNVGALVVSSDGTTIEGMLSERDVVRRLSVHGAAVLGDTVAECMTPEVHTCRRADTSDQLMARMTASRMRHLPVEEEAVLAGIISIGDVVKSRLEELETAASSLREYITGSSY